MRIKWNSILFLLSALLATILLLGMTASTRAGQDCQSVIETCLSESLTTNGDSRSLSVTLHAQNDFADWFNVIVPGQEQVEFDVGDTMTLPVPPSGKVVYSVQACSRNFLSSLCDGWRTVKRNFGPVALPELPPCPEGQIRLKGKCKVPQLLDGTHTGNGGGFIQMIPDCPAGQKFDQNANGCVAANSGGGGATAATDTTIYDQPQGNDVAYLSAGDPVSIVSCNDNNWCKISKPQKGWVWGEDLNR